MSGQFPTDIEIAGIQFESDDPYLLSKSQSGKRQTRLIGSHVWRANISFNLMTEAECRKTYSFLMRQRAGTQSFTIILPGHDLALGAIDGTPTYTSKTSDNEIVTGGWNTNIVDQVKWGDVFTIAGDSKVYMAVQDLDSDGSGNGNLIFEPALRQTPGASAALTFDNVAFTCALLSKPSYRRNGPLWQIDDIQVEEAL